MMCAIPYPIIELVAALDQSIDVKAQTFYTPAQKPVLPAMLLLKS